MVAKRCHTADLGTSNFGVEIRDAKATIALCGQIESPHAILWNFRNALAVVSVLAGALMVLLVSGVRIVKRLAAGT